jgi:transcriptional regulator with XRE-family HTH domain
MTRLGEFISREDLGPARLARRAGISRQHLYRLRYGKQEPTRPMMVRLARASSGLLKRDVSVTELFEIEP